MKKTSFVAIALLASAAFGEPSGPYMSYLGYQVGQSGSGEYSNYIGAYSGQYSTWISRCGFYGPASGQYGYKLYGCNGVGFYALANSEYMTNVFAVGTSAARDADHCEDCIYIGKDAGRNFSHRKGDVVIGDVLIHTNGVTTIKGFANSGDPFNGMAEFVKNGYYIDFYANEVWWNDLEGMHIPDGSIAIGPHGTLLDEAPQNNGTLVNGDGCCAYQKYSHAEGKDTATYGDGHGYSCSHAEGYLSQTHSSYSHAEGQGTRTYGQSSHAEGYFCIASNAYAHAEGDSTVASGNGSHAEGRNTVAAGTYSSARGVYTKATGYGAYASGAWTEATAQHSMAYGNYSYATNELSVVWNGVKDLSTPARYYSHGFGTYNINPVGGIDGIWVGEKTMRKHISDEIEKPRTSFTIEDEDTGEKYIIKVKSGALKLYKVEETEE